MYSRLNIKDMCILDDMYKWRGGWTNPLFHSFFLQRECTVEFPESNCSGMVSIINVPLDLYTKLMFLCPSPSLCRDNTVRPPSHFSHQLKGIVMSEMFKFRANYAMI